MGALTAVPFAAVPFEDREIGGLFDVRVLAAAVAVAVCEAAGWFARREVLAGPSGAGWSFGGGGEPVLGLARSR